MSDGAMMCPGCAACRCGKAAHDDTEIAVLRARAEAAEAEARTARAERDAAAVIAGRVVALEAEVARLKAEGERGWILARGGLDTALDSYLWDDRLEAEEAAAQANRRYVDPVWRVVPVRVVREEP